MRVKELETSNIFTNPPLHLQIFIELSGISGSDCEKRKRKKKTNKIKEIKG